MKVRVLTLLSLVVVLASVLTGAGVSESWQSERRLDGEALRLGSGQVYRDSRVEPSRNQASDSTNNPLGLVSMRLRLLDPADTSLRSYSTDTGFALSRRSPNFYYYMRPTGAVGAQAPRLPDGGELSRRLSDSRDLEGHGPMGIGAGRQLAENVGLVGQIGGRSYAVAVQGNYAYLGVGPRLVVVDVSDPASPTMVGQTAVLPAIVRGIYAAGGPSTGSGRRYAYVADDWAGLRVVDVSDPAAPVEVGVYSTPGDAESVYIAGGYAYVVDGYGLRVVDVSNPVTPVEVGGYDTPGLAVDVHVAGGYAYVADWVSGLRVVDVSNPAAPAEVGAYDTPGFAWGVYVTSGYAYIADKGSGLRIVDVSAPTAPVEVGVYDTPGSAQGIYVADSYAYVADGDDGLRVVDVSNPTAPAEVGAYDTPGFAEGIQVAGGPSTGSGRRYAYVVDEWAGLRVVGVSDPAVPTEVGAYDTVGDAIGVHVANGFAYVVTGEYGGLQVVGVSDPTAPMEVGAYDTLGEALGIYVAEGYAYVADGGAGVRVVDVSTSTAPAEVGIYDTPGDTEGIHVVGDYAHVADGDAGLRVVDVSDPTAPAEVGAYDTPGYASGVYVTGHHAYVADQWAGLRVVDISDPAIPVEVGAYNTPGYAGGVYVADGYAYVADWDHGLRVIDVSNPAAPVEVGAYDTPGFAQDVYVAGGPSTGSGRRYAYVADEGAGLWVVDVSDPATPVEVGYYNTPGLALGIYVAGDYAYVADGSGGLFILRFTGGGTPDIGVTPLALETTLPEGLSTTVPLTISNAGDATLTFSITKERGSRGDGEMGGKGEREKGKKGKGEYGGVGVGKVDSALLDALDAAPDGQAAFMVYLEEQADPSTSSGQALSAAYAIRDWKARGEYVYRTLRETAQRSQKDLLADLEARRLAGQVTRVRPFFIVNAIAVTGDRSTVDALASRPDVAHLISDFGYFDWAQYRFRISDFASAVRDPQPLDYAQDKSAIRNTQYAIRNTAEWNIRQIGADRVWDELGVTGEGVVVASIDTGVDYTHPALVNQYRGTATGSHDYNWYDPTGRYPDAPGDNNGHGTQVMGTMVGDDPSTGSGQAGAGNRIGVAPGAQWIAARGCAGDWWCATSDLLAAAEWMLAPCDLSGSNCDPGKRPHVVNNSWGGSDSNLWFEQVISAWRAAGIFPAFSAGSMGPDEGSITSPGDYAVSFATGATDRADAICWSSGRGPSWHTPGTKPNVVAPGCGGIRLAQPGGGYITGSGVSASAHTAGVAALLRAANPSLTVEELEGLLVSTAVDLGPAGPDYTYGYGRLDAYAAVEAANDPPFWLSLDPTSGSVEPGRQTVISVTLNTSGLSNGAYTADVAITSNDPDEPTVSVPVTLTVTSGRPKIAHVRVSNVRDVSAAVSWTTNVSATGQVYYGTGPAGTSTGLSTDLTNVAYDDRGAEVEGNVHHVTIGGLSPNTTYYFYVASDDATDDNEGQYYRFTTGAPLSPPAVDAVYGQVFKSDGVTPAADVLVYLRVLDNDGSGNLGQSGLLSGLTDSNGYWIDPQTNGAVNLAAARTENGQRYFVYSESGDAVRVEVQGATDCEGLMQIDTADDAPAPPVTLSCLKMMGFDIYPGWQTIVFPALPDPDYDAGRLLEDIESQGGCPAEIEDWVSELSDWSGYLYGLPFGNLPLEPGTPYFLRATCHSPLRLPAYVSIAPSECITLTTGWNFVALPRAAGVITAESACEQITAQGGSVSEIDRWAADVGNWAGHICGLPFGDFEMTPEEGYFIKSQADSVWCPSGSEGQ